MQLNVKQNSILICVVLLFNACSNKQPTLPKINNNVAFKYIQQYEKQYRQINSSIKNSKEYIKWIQAANKIEQCKLFVGYNPYNDRTSKEGYKIFWDGKCKDGYAYGLGREMERGPLISLDAIAIYKGGKNKPEYFIQKNNLSNVTLEGDINNGYFVKTYIKDDGINFDIHYEYGHFPTNSDAIRSTTIYSPFSDRIRFAMIYPNFAYIFDDYSKDEFASFKFTAALMNRQLKLNGYSFVVYKNHNAYGVEFQNGKLIRKVFLPKEYLKHLTNVLDEIKKAGKIALLKQKQALIVKQQYKNGICKNNVKVTFMDNKEYKNICNEFKQNAILKKKINEKLAYIEKIKEAKRKRIYQERLIQAREIEAMAAQRQAEAAESANFIQSLQNINNTMQMQQFNFQMQQLNNNLMMNNFTPKIYDIYLH